MKSSKSSFTSHNNKKLVETNDNYKISIGLPLNKKVSKKFTNQKRDFSKLNSKVKLVEGSQAVFGI